MKDSNKKKLLPIADTITKTFFVLRVQRGVFARVLFIVSIILMAVSIFTFRKIFEHEMLTSYIWMNISIFLGGVIAYTLFAVTVHRVIILGTASVPKYGFYYITFREIYFMITVFVAYYLASWVVGMPMTILEVGMMFISESNVNMEWLNPLLVIPFYYIFARLSLMFPAIAIDKKYSLETAWKISKNNGWRLTFLVGLVPWVLDQTAYIFIENSSSFITDVTISFVYMVVLMFEIAILTVSYQHLASVKSET